MKTRFTCSKCKKNCFEVFECDCSEYSDMCEECWYNVSTKHREEWCFVEWMDYEGVYND